MEGRTGLSFPHEIWWLVAQEFARRRDFGGLFLCARLGRGMARVALPELYAIHHQSPALDAHILDVESSVCLWRSIIVSSLGKTLFPYCCWIKALRLGNLLSHLEDLARGKPRLKAQFFSPPLEKLQIRRGRGKALYLDAIIVEVANMVTECIRTSADHEARRAGITTLEGLYLPTANLPTWVSSLSSLTSLSVRDGSVLTSEVASAIRANCPAFRELECYFCKGTDIDEQLAGFFRSLEPNSLQSFTIRSMNSLGRESFRSLCEHSQSLKTLSLLSLEIFPLRSLNELQHCVFLESLRLEGGWSARSYLWAEDCKQGFQEVVQWLQNCAFLKVLEFTMIPESTTLLAKVLKSPSIRLLSLSIKTPDLDKEFCEALPVQDRLQHLAVKIPDGDLLEASDERHMMLANAITCCHDLRELDTNELFTFEEIEGICDSLPLLEDIVLNGDLIEDVFLAPIRRLRNLKSLTTYGPSSFSLDALLDFINHLSEDPEGDHDGLYIYITNQDHDFRFTDVEEVMVRSALSAKLKGRFDINYRADPYDPHEDSSD